MFYNIGKSSFELKIVQKYKINQTLGKLKKKLDLVLKLHAYLGD